MGTNAIAVCEHCRDELPVIVSDGGAVNSLRPGESCECGDEAFRLVDPAADEQTSADPERRRLGDVRAV